MSEAPFIAEGAEHLADEAADSETVVREHRDAALRTRWIAEAVSVPGRLPAISDRMERSEETACN